MKCAIVIGLMLFQFVEGFAATLLTQFELGHEKVRIDALGSNLYRVRLSEKGEFVESLLNRYGIIDEGKFKGEEGESKAFSFDSSWQELTVELNKGEMLKIGLYPIPEGNRALNPSTTKRVIRFVLENDERIYGLGDMSRENIMRRPGRYELKVRNNKSNIPIPMLLSNRGWGMLLNSTWYGFVDIGKTNLNEAKFLLDGGAIDFYLFFGRDYRAMLNTYTQLTGRPKLLPAFGYGISYVENQYIDQFNLLNDAAHFREREFPCDVLGLEPGWMEKFYDKSVHKRFNRERFNFPYWAPTASFTWPNVLKRMGFKLSLWLCCDYDLTRYEEELVNGTREREAESGGKEGTQLKTAIWEDNHITGKKDEKLKYPYGIEGMEVIERAIEDDYPEGALPWFEHLKKFVDRGARCFKLDGANQLSPSKREWANGRPHEEVRNIYPVIYAKQMSQGYEDYKNQRSMIYSSGGFVGVQQYVATWAGDTGGGIGPLISILNHGFSGHSNQTCDMEVEDLAGLHFGIFQPWSQLSSWEGWFNPWFYPKAHQETIRKYWQLRYRLFPYLYTAAAEASRSGWPMMRALPLVYPENPTYDRVMTTYLLGDDLLVSAFTNKTIIPPGIWFDYRTGEKVIGPCERDEKLTSSWGGGIYLRGGSIIPTWPQPEFIEKGWNEQVILHLWLDDTLKEYTGSLYEDDGDSLDYMKGAFTITPLKVVREGHAFRVKIGPRKGTYKDMPQTRKFKVIFHSAQGSLRELDLSDVGEYAERVLMFN